MSFSIRNAINNSIRNLPCGYVIAITLKNSNGDVELTGPDGCHIEVSSNQEGLAETIEDALASALDDHLRRIRNAKIVVIWRN